MKLTVFNLGMLTAGVYLIWCGVTDRNPVEVARSALTGKGIPERGSWGGEKADDEVKEESGLGPEGAVGGGGGGGGGGSF